MEGAEDELLGDQPSNASDQADSGCLSPLVSMVQSTDSRQCDYFRRRRRSVREDTSSIAADTDSMQSDADARTRLLDDPPPIASSEFSAENRVISAFRY